MSLPNLPDLEEFEYEESKKASESKKMREPRVKEPVKKAPTKKKERKELRIPKSRYDDDGNPILTIPDLNDVNLVGEIDKYFGDKGGM